MEALPSSVRVIELEIIELLSGKAFSINRLGQAIYQVLLWINHVLNCGNNFFFRNLKRYCLIS